MRQHRTYSTHRFRPFCRQRTRRLSHAGNVSAWPTLDQSQRAGVYQFWAVLDSARVAIGQVGQQKRRNDCFLAQESHLSALFCCGGVPNEVEIQNTAGLHDGCDTLADDWTILASLLQRPSQCLSPGLHGGTIFARQRSSPGLADLHRGWYSGSTGRGQGKVKGRAPGR